MSENLELWNSVCSTDRRFVREFKKQGGFAGTAINPLYSVNKATSLWGPCGGKWGFTVIDQQYTETAPIIDPKTGACHGHEKTHTVLLEVWYPTGLPEPGDVGRVQHSGGTMVCWQDKYGKIVTDDDHCKKSITDALSKCLSMLGFSADIWLGGNGFEDNKFTAERSDAGRKIMLPDADEQSMKRAMNAILAAPDKATLDGVKSRYSMPGAYSEAQLKTLNKAYDDKVKLFAA